MQRKPSMTDADYAIAERLILDDYLRFLTGQPRPGEDPADPEAFARRHTSATTALAHLGQLQRSVRGDARGDAGAAGEAAGHLEAARAAVAALAAEARSDDGRDG